MRNKYFEKYDELSVENKRDILLKEICEVLETLETLCVRKRIQIDKLKSEHYIKNRELLFDDDYYELMFVYITYIKEDLALLLEESA